METVEKWGMFEVSAQGRTEGNPFTDYTIKGVFRGKNETVETSGFYDGDGVYKVRFMPSFEGEYTYEVSGSFSEKAVTGSFLAMPPSGDNHGPVRVANTYHFAYEEARPIIPLAPPAKPGLTSRRRSGRRHWKSFPRGISTKCGSAYSPSTISIISRIP